MKNFVLFVLRTWSFSVLIGQSCSSAFGANGSDDGAVSAGRSKRFDLPRDSSDPIIDRYTRNDADDGLGEEPSPSPKFNHLILIVPAILGVATIVFIVGVVCYQMRKSGRNRCLSNECLIWCGIMARDRSTYTPAAVIDSSVNYPVVVPQVAEKTEHIPPSVDDQGYRKPEYVKLLGAIPSNTSPTRRVDTPSTDSSMLTTDDEGMSPNVPSSKETTFRYLNTHPKRPGRSGTVTPTSPTGKFCHLEDEYGRRDIAEVSSDDDHVFKNNENNNFIDSGVGSEDAGAADKPLVRQYGIRRKRPKESEGGIPGGHRKCPPKCGRKQNYSDTKELEAAVTKSDTSHIEYDKEDRSHLSRNTKQHEQTLNRIGVSQGSGNTVANGNQYENTCQVLTKPESVYNTGSKPEEKPSQTGGSNDPPYAVPITNKHISYVQHLHLKVEHDAKLDIGKIKDFQVGERQTHIHHYHHHRLPPTPEQDLYSHSFDRNGKGRQTY